MDLTAMGSEELNQERLDFVLEELKKNYIPTDLVKIAFFARYFQDIIEEEVKCYLVIVNNKYREHIPGVQLDWLLFDNNLEENISAQFISKGYYNE